MDKYTESQKELYCIIVDLQRQTAGFQERNRGSVKIRSGREICEGGAELQGQQDSV